MKRNYLLLVFLLASCFALSACEYQYLPGDDASAPHHTEIQRNNGAPGALPLAASA